MRPPLLNYLHLYLRYRKHTMVNACQYISCLRLIDGTLRNRELGRACIVECGTWRGGMSAGLIEVCGLHRDFYFFDSFAGLPPAGPEDGDAAVRWQSDESGDRYFNNCTADLSDFTKVVSRTGISTARLHIYKGLFAETMAQVDMPSIAILRLDADWYSSTMTCLEHLWDKVAIGGLIIIDDYFDWEGCRKAIHRFLGERLCAEAIEHTSFSKVTFIQKGYFPHA